MRLFPAALMIATCAACSASAHEKKRPQTFGLDTARIETLTGLRGNLNQDEAVFKVTSPRSDVPVSVDRWALPPFMGLTSWAAFQAGRKAEAMVMGDLVLFEDEVNPVMSVCLAEGLTVTALHNHFFFAEPRVYFMHLGGEGAQDALAAAVGKALAKVKEIRAAKPTPASDFGKPIPKTSSITGGTIEETLGVKGQAKDGMFKVVIGRKVRVACGCEVGKEMGVNTWAAFAGTDDDAVADGDFAVLEEELQPVLKALRKADINIVAIHHHMTFESPRMLFLHYWGRGKTSDLARGIKTALDVQNK